VVLSPLSCQSPCSSLLLDNCEHWEYKHENLMPCKGCEIGNPSSFYCIRWEHKEELCCCWATCS
jgi:hypothetical protein